MKTILDLPGELLEDGILSRLPMTSLRSVRSTCRKWNTLCKNRIFFGKEAKNQFLMMEELRISLMNFDLHDPSLKQVSVLDQIQISNMVQCDGLLLCVLKDCSRLLVWNPYLGQTRWVEPKTSFESSDGFALGHDHNNNLNYKILRISDENHPNFVFEVYDFSSISWKVLDVTQDWQIRCHLHSVSLKGNAYFSTSVKGFFVCFDFATESFGPLLPLPSSQSYHGLYFMSFSCVRQEQLATLYQQWDARETMEISVTDKIGPDVASWTKFLKLNIGLWVDPTAGSFLIDEEKKIAVVFVLERVNASHYQTAHVIGQDGYFKSVRIRKAPYRQDTSSPNNRYYLPVVCSSYLPSLVQLNQPCQWKERM